MSASASAVPRASVIVPTYSRGPLLTDTLRTLCRCTGAEYEIVVVDQSPTVAPEVLAVVHAHPEVRYLRISEVGLPNARNFGISQARGDVVLFCDDDVIPASGWVAAHLSNYAEGDVGGVAGRVVAKDACARSGSHGPVGRISRWTGSQMDRFDATTRADVDHAQGCNMSFRKAALDQIGGFDTRFGGSAFLEETDACMRVRQAGYRIVFDPAAELVHLKEQSGGCRSGSEAYWYYWYGHNYVLLFLKNFPRRRLPVFSLFRGAHLLGSALRSGNPFLLIWGVTGMLAGGESYFGLSTGRGRTHTQMSGQSGPPQ